MLRTIRPFLLERYFAKHEFSAPYLLSSSDCGGWKQDEIIALADPEAAALWRELRLGYTESRGLPLLRREIASLYEDADPEEVLVAAPQELIALAMNALLRPGDHAVCTFPGYQSLYEIAAGIGCEISKWEPSESAGWRFDVARLAEMLRPNTKLIIINFPHNPTGALPPKEDFLRIIELARSRGIYLFSDEMYRLLEFDDGDRLPAACELYENAISLSGMSKAFGMAGIRIGWLVVKDKAAYGRIAALKDYTTICSAGPSELLALIGLRSKELLLGRLRERIAGNLGLLDAFFARHRASFCWIRPKAGTVGFPRRLSEEPVDAFCARALREAGVLLLPSSVYEYGETHFRVGFGRENMVEALERFEGFLTKK